jgi:hypothetical protein
MPFKSSAQRKAAMQMIAEQRSRPHTSPQTTQQKASAIAKAKSKKRYKALNTSMAQQRRPAGPGTKKTASTPRLSSSSKQTQSKTQRSSGYLPPSKGYL